MALVVTNSGELTILQWMLRLAGGNLTLHLYKNNYTPTATSTTGDFTECDFAGYAEVEMLRGTFSSAFLNAGLVAEIAYPTQTFNFGEDQTVFGYYLTDSSGNLVAADKLPQPRVQVLGDVYFLQPRFTGTFASGSVVTNLGAVVLLDWLMKSIGEATSLKLFKNDYTPVSTSVTGDFTEATFGGYTSTPLTRAGWSAPTTNLEGIAVMDYSTAIDYTPSTTETVYGIYVVNAGGTTLWAFRFGTPISTSIPFSIQPSFSLRGEA